MTFSRRLETESLSSCKVRYGRTIIRLNVPPFFANELLLLPRLAFVYPGARRDRHPHRNDVLRAENVIHPKRTCPSSWVAGPWEGLVVHELFAQNFISGVLAGFLAGPIPSTPTKISTARRCCCTKSVARPGRSGRPGLGIEPLSNPIGSCDFEYHVGRRACCRARCGGGSWSPRGLSADRFNAGGLIKLFAAELTNQRELLISCIGRRICAREDLQELTRWDKKASAGSRDSSTVLYMSQTSGW